VGSTGPTGASGATGASGPTPTWSSYTPVWNGTIGTGTLTGSYAVLGKTCFVNINHQFATPGAWPSGQWTYSLPVATSTLANQFLPLSFNQGEGSANIGLAAIGPSSSSALLFAVVFTNSGANPVNVPLLEISGADNNNGSILIQGFYNTA
jgi:hypothetical protein